MWNYLFLKNNKKQQNRTITQQKMPKLQNHPMKDRRWMSLMTQYQVRMNKDRKGKEEERKANQRRK